MDTTTTSTGMNRRHDTNGGSREIKAHIEETRAHMDDTLDALSERLRPRHLIDDILDYWHSRRQSSGGNGQAKRKVKQAAGHVKDTAGDAGRTIVRQVQQHPIPSLLIGAGIAWLFMEKDREEYDEYEVEVYDEGDSPDDEFGYENQIQPGPGPETYALPSHYSDEEDSSSGGVLGKLKGKGSEMANKAGEKWERTKRSTARRAGAMRGRAQERSRRLRELARHGYEQGVETFKRTSDDYPLAMGAGFLALGVVAGMLLPSTRKEDRWVGPTRDRLVHRSQEAAHDALERGKHVAQSAASAAKSELREQGLTPEQIKAKAQHVMESARETARQEGLTPETLKQKAQTAATHVKDTTKQEAKKEGQEFKNQV